MEVRYDCNVPNYGRKAKFWRSVDSLNEAIDYNSICYGNIPLNSYAYQFPKVGDSYFLTTLLCQPTLCPTYNSRGYFRNRLKSSLVNGKTYCVKFYVNISDNSSYGIDAIGAYFGDNTLDTIIYGSYPLTYLTPQIQNQAGNIITDTLNWTLITGTFVANGTEKHCVIGNFKSDANTTKLLINPTNLPAIFCNVLLDAVSCIPIDLPAYAGPDVYAPPSSTVYIGRLQDVGIDEACTWYNLTNTTTPVANAAGFSLTVSAVTATYMVKQDICGIIKYDTVVVYAGSVGLNKYNYQNVVNYELYPNPAINEVTITSNTNSTEKLEVRITDVNGKLLISKTLITIDFRADLKLDLLNGIYFVNLINENGTKTVKKLVIAKY